MNSFLQISNHPIVGGFQGLSFPFATIYFMMIKEEKGSVKGHAMGSKVLEYSALYGVKQHGAFW